MSRLDVDTCQTSIKTDILFSAAVTHIPEGLWDRREITVSSPTELNKECKLKQNNGSPKYV